MKIIIVKTSSTKESIMCYSIAKEVEFGLEYPHSDEINGVFDQVLHNSKHVPSTSIINLTT